MRPAVIAFALAFAQIVSAAPRMSARVRMVASGALDARVLSTSRDNRALVIVRVNGGAEILRRAGFDATPLVGPFASLRVTRASLAKLSAMPEVESIEERRILHPLLDKSAAAIGAPQIRARTGIDGSGVLVGVVDTGIDFHHADFRAADGSTRIAALLDLATPADSRHTDLGNFGGAIWLQDEIDAALSGGTAIPEQDVDGHGTHVAGIAAGNGLATGNGFAASRYVGIAPGAQLIIAQATRDGSTFSDADVLTACSFVLARANALQKPIALNLSIGGGGGPHDGSSSLEQALDMMVPLDMPGVALAVAAGNDGGNDLHAAGYALDGVLSLPLSVGKSQIENSAIAIELWALGSPSVAVITPSGRRYGPVAVGKDTSGITAEGQVAIDNDAGARADGLVDVGISIVGATEGEPAQGNWTIEISGALPRWDAWIVESPDDTVVAFTDQISEDDRLVVPATATHAIVAGSFVTRNAWTEVNGQAISRAVTIGDTSFFSSSGPTYDGRFAPDVIAPGEYVASSLSTNTDPSMVTSSFYVPGSPQFAVVEDGVHAVLRGTSQAAPHVTGTLALLFAADPTLTANDAREILRMTARPSDVGFSTRAGFGELSAGGAINYAKGARGAIADADVSTVAVSRDLVPPGSMTTTVSVTPKDSNGVPLGGGRDVVILLTAGVATSDVVDFGGRYERTYAAQAPLGTVAIATAVVDGVMLSQHPSVFFTDDRRDIGDPFVARGGCDFSPTRDAPGVGAVLFISLLLLWGLPRRTRSPIVRAFMSPGRTIALVAAIFLGGVGCSHEIGDSCSLNVDCDPTGQRFCDTAAPGGYCTIEGCDVGTCPDEAVCIRFFTTLQNEPCTVGPLPDDRGRQTDGGMYDCVDGGGCYDCRVDERCVCDQSHGSTCADGGVSGNGHCAPEDSERRWCELACGSNSDCRTGYTCRPTGTNGSETLPVGGDGGTTVTPALFCAPLG